MLKIAVFPNVEKPASAGVLKRIFNFYADKDSSTSRITPCRTSSTSRQISR